jgi:predicted GIY-YIG superfamily endonuclease
MGVAIRCGRRRAPASHVVYLVHFDKRYHHARHYVGFSEHLGRRMGEHRAGAGSRLLRAVAAAGVPFDVVFTSARSTATRTRRGCARYVQRPHAAPRRTSRAIPMRASRNRRARAHD